jgi:hypothetical protein
MKYMTLRRGSIAHVCECAFADLINKLDRVKDFKVRVQVNDSMIRVQISYHSISHKRALIREIIQSLKNGVICKWSNFMMFPD